MRLYKIEDKEDEILSCISNHTAIANNIRQSGHRGALSWHNEIKSVIHQFKLHNWTQDGSSCTIKSDCYVTMSSNIWCRYNDNVVTIDYFMNYAKYDIFFGIVSADEFDQSVGYFHYQYQSDVVEHGIMHQKLIWI